MFLKSLEMQGFKSFPDKTALDFGQGITAVVGPNGSGKSNISDAVRWVLGEQSTKNLRGAKMEDVVFSGTNDRRAQGFAEVTLRLDNSDHALPRDDKEVAVTRRYYRSGESNYLLNGEVVRLRDVQELFMDTGLGRDGYSLVSQGKIADMISSRSGERRDMFEEAAGISHFRYRRTDAQRRLMQAEDNLVRLRDILSELEGRVGPLKRQSEQAERFLVLAAEKKELEIGLWLHTIARSREQLREQEHKIALAAAQYEGAEQELARIEEEIEAVIAQSQELTVRADEIRHGAAQMEEEAARLDAQAAVDENSVEHNNEAIARIERDKELANDTRQHIEEQIGQAEQAIRDLERAAEEKRASLEQSAARMQQLQQENETFAGRIGELTQAVSALSIALGDSRVAQSTAQSSLDEIHARLAAIDESLSTRGETLDDLKNRQRQAASAREDAVQQAQAAANAVQGYALRLDSRRAKAEKLKKAQEDLSLEARQKQARIRMLDDLEKNMEGYSGSVKAVMREVKRGSLTGVHGPLSQLISVPQKYAAAIETALGAAVQYIVTDHENDAKRAIHFLQANRAGRATFLPISAIRARAFQEKGLDRCPGYIDLAASLITYDPQYEEIVRAQLGRTAVAEDMDSAIAIARQYQYRFRIVTLDGQVVNAGGSMTGGSRTQNAGILSRANEIETLTGQMHALQGKLEEATQAAQAAQQELGRCEAELAAAQADLARAQEDVIRRESDCTLIDGQLHTALTAVDELTAEQAQAAQRIEALEATSAQAAQRIESLTGQIETQEQALGALTGDREALMAKRESLSEQAAQINLEIVAAQKDMQAQRDIIERLRSRQESHAGRLEELDAEIAQIGEKNAALSAQAVSLREQAAALRAKEHGTKEEVDALMAQRNTCEARSAELRLLERGKAGEREKLSGELARLEERKAAMRKEYDETVNKLYDEYQLTRREAEETGITIDDPPKAQRRLSELRNSIRALGSVNVGAIEEYKEVAERYEFMRTQINDIEQSRDEITHLIDDLTEKMALQFREQFNRINMNFGQTFAELFGGGKAELALEDPHNVLECGIEIKVQPPGKNVQNIDLLSGGEKGLAAIAMLFAILKVTPAPFCIFDEVEAALDDVNVTRYAQYVRRMTDKTQFILITHRRGTMEEADVLYGVTMQEKGVSKLLELKTAEMAQKMGIA